MRLVKSKALLHQANRLVEVSPDLVVLDQVIEVIGVDDDVKSCACCESELFNLDTSVADVLPRRDSVRLTGRCDGLAILVQVEVAERQFRIVVDAARKKAVSCCLRKKGWYRKCRFAVTLLSHLIKSTFAA